MTDTYTPPKIDVERLAVTLAGRDDTIDTSRDGWWPRLSDIVRQEFRERARRRLIGEDRMSHPAAPTSQRKLESVSRASSNPRANPFPRKNGL